MKRHYDLTPYIYYAGFCPLREPKHDVHTCKSHSPNATELSSALSSLSMKAGQHGSSINLYLLAGLKISPLLPLQCLLWFTLVCTQGCICHGGKPEGFLGRVLLKNALRDVLIHLPSSVSPNQHRFKLRETIVCVGTVQHREKGGHGCICAALAPPSGKTGPVSLHQMDAGTFPAAFRLF